ncbi:hypothetical protein GSI_02962 [Ganoderma sinense ZZ0214-1]|uniref:F-box domain-containing protein n=1 Tax=Ganoderma sinense ZZ0214-1 TaxID=1077348 RepID=A0A2G8SN29_9APHY|nr:hypothetical protein GSI_02962 [Ganoderma sinense ZZ0214-1]
MEYKEPPTLPYDIYCLVVDVLAADDSDSRLRYRTLRSCALTSSAWLTRAHFHLYRKVVLRTRQTLLSFARTIADSPHHFAPLIEHIDVKVSPALGCGWPNDHRQVDIPVPPAAIAQMAKLQSARFAGSFQFAETPASLLAFVRAFAACGALRKVALHGFFIPQFRDLVAIVWAFPHMASLSLVECGWCTPRSGLELPDPNVFPGRCQNLDKLLCPFAIPNLEPIPIPICAKPPAIAAFTSLTRITIVFSALQWPITLLAHVRSEHVRELTMKLSADCLSDDESAADAARLDDLLQRAPLRGIRRVTVVPFWQDARRGHLYRDEWVRTVQARLPQCHSRSILRTPTP